MLPKDNATASKVNYRYAMVAGIPSPTPSLPCPSTDTDIKTLVVEWVGDPIHLILTAIEARQMPCLA